MKVSAADTMERIPGRIMRLLPLVRARSLAEGINISTINPSTHNIHRLAAGTPLADPDFAYFFDSGAACALMQTVRCVYLRSDSWKKSLWYIDKSYDLASRRCVAYFLNSKRFSLFSLTLVLTFSFSLPFVSVSEGWKTVSINLTKSTKDGNFFHNFQLSLKKSNFVYFIVCSCANILS